MIRKSVVAISIALVFSFWRDARESASQIRGLTIGPGGERYPIAISSFKNLGILPDRNRVSEKLADVIAKDLDLTGWFKVLDRSAYIEHPQTGGSTQETIDFRSWSVIGAEALVKGAVSVEGDQISVEARLFDVVQRKQAVGKRYVGKSRDMARIAHKFADEIIRQFTGEPGVFNTKIAFIATKDRFKELFLMNLDGSELVQLTQNRTINISPSWTPDGQAIVFTSYKELNPDLFQIDWVTRREAKLSTRAGLNLGGKWSPDGRTLAVALEKEGNVEIYLLNKEGAIVRRLTDHPDIDVSPSWSPDGKRIAFVSARTGSPQIYLVPVDGGSPKRVTYAGSYNTSPAWSPVGNLLAYSGRSGGVFDIYTIDADGGSLARLTDGKGRNEDPSWSPDGRFICFSSTRDGKPAIYIMQSSGNHVRRLTSREWSATNPAWSPRLE
jgi:TolB protein